MATRASTATILVVDDEPIIRDTVAEFLAGHRFLVETAASGEEAIKKATARRFDVVLCDVNLPGLDGIEVLERLRKISPETFVLLITAYATVESAVEAFQKGAHDYLMKPILLHEVLGKVRRLLEHRDLFRENRWLRQELNREANDGEMVVGKSPAMRQAVEMAKKVAPTPSPVLVLGENGSGKQLFARAVHRYARASGRFVAVNCAASPAEVLEDQLFGHRRGAFAGAERDRDGVFVHAGPGTVFLDEIGAAPPGVQAKLLRAIEQKEVLPVGANEPVAVEARIVAATNKDLAVEVEAGRFRDELFYRLNVFAIRLPSLRDRREDIPELIDVLLAKHARAMGKKVTGASHEAVRLLSAYPWKGNVRELDNALQRAVIVGDGPLLTPADLPPDLATPNTDPSAVDELNAAVERFEKLHIERMLRLTPDKKEAAKRLGIGLSSLYRKIEQYGIVTIGTA
ncbi:MAG TPA: sigma-54 dependent transcriptional regulator [Fimbriiglobus sp.]|jgi:DNA-binding NtrC family response regulator